MTVLPDPPPMDGWRSNPVLPVQQTQKQTIRLPSKIELWASVAVLFTCAVAMVAYAVTRTNPPPVYGMAEPIAFELPPSSSNEVRIQVEVDSRTGRAPVWRDLFAQYGLSRDVSRATIARFNTQLQPGEEAATPDSPIPSGREIVIVLPANR